jgi:hypothetical protein
MFERTLTIRGLIFLGGYYLNAWAARTFGCKWLHDERIGPCAKIPENNCLRLPQPPSQLLSLKIGYTYLGTARLQEAVKGKQPTMQLTSEA